MKKKSVGGFDFVLIGYAYLSHERLETKFNGDPLSWNVAIGLLHPEAIYAEKSVYLVCNDNDPNPLYIGQYSETFAARWLRSSKYSWHSDNVDMRIKNALELCERISIWLSLDPYIKTNQGVVYNISKVIEEILIEKLKPEWNKVGKNRNHNKSMSVQNIREKFNSSIPSMEAALIEELQSISFKPDAFLTKLPSINDETDRTLDSPAQQDEELYKFLRSRRFLHHIEEGKSHIEAARISREEFPEFKQNHHR